MPRPCLVGVLDREGDLGRAAVAEADVARERDGAALEVADEGAALLPVGLEERLDELRPERREAVEAQVAAAIGEPLEEGEQLVGVGRQRRAQPQRRPVPEDDVGRLECRRAHLPILAAAA